MSFSFNKSKNRKEGWGMGFLLVFFPEDNNNPNSTAINVDNNKLFSQSSLRRTNSSRLFTKAQSTISICALLVFVTLLLFTLSTFEPSSRTQAPIGIFATRRFLSEVRRTNTLSHGLKIKSQRALQGLGTLYRRGTKSVSDLVVAHVAEETKEDELRLFLRTLHRSGLTAKSDVVLLFPSPFHRSKFESLIQEENAHFLTLVNKHREANKSSSAVKLSFDPAQFRPGKKEPGEPIWGKKVSSNESTQMSYGSVVGFDTPELDPENSLAGFMDFTVPMGLRRWACYPMLLGRVRRNFKHVALLDARTAVALGDHVGPGGPRSPESVHFYDGQGSKHGKPNKAHSGVNSGVISGGARGVRRLSDAMLAEIVRVASSAGLHKKKGYALTDAAVLNQLVGNENLLKNVKVVRPGEFVAEANDLSFLKSGVVQRGNGNNNNHEVVKSVIMKHICANEIDSSVYRDCTQKVIE